MKEKYYYAEGGWDDGGWRTGPNGGGDIFRFPTREARDNWVAESPQTEFYRLRRAAVPESHTEVRSLKRHAKKYRTRVWELEFGDGGQRGSKDL